MKASRTQTTRIGELAQRLQVSIPLIETVTGVALPKMSEEVAGNVIAVLVEIETSGIPGNKIEAAAAFRDLWIPAESPATAKLRAPRKGEDPVDYVVEVLGLDGERECPGCRGKGTVLSRPSVTETWRTACSLGPKTGVGKVAVARKLANPSLSALRQLADGWFDGDLNQAAAFTAHTSKLLEKSS